MDFIGLGFLFAFLLGLVVIAALGLSMLRALRGTKPATAPGSAGSLLSNAERVAADAISGLRGPAHGQTHGQMFDQAEALGAQLVSGGYMADADWQPIFETIAKSLTHKAHAPAVHAPAATEAPSPA